MGKVLARATISIEYLGDPDLQEFTPEQTEALKKILEVQESPVDMELIADAVKELGEPLSPDRVEAVLQQHPWLETGLAEASKKYDNAIRKAVRAGLDTYPYKAAPCEQERSSSHNADACDACKRNRTLYELSRLGIIGYPSSA